MFLRLDSFLVRRVFQPMVDLLRIDPLDLARQCALAHLVLVVGFALADGRWVTGEVLGLTIAGVVVLQAVFEPGTLRLALGHWWMRMLCTAVLAVLVLSLLLAGAVLPLVSAVLAGGTFLAFMYFLACRRPS